MDESFSFAHWRMDWGFANPNKTAALIALIMIAVWGLAYVHRWGFWASLPLFIGFGACLVLTQSRGGVSAVLIGGIALFAWAPRPFVLRRGIAVAIALLSLVLLAFATDTSSRYVHGLSGSDQSLTNRWLIWKQVPSMIHDAPNGWGLGQSGEAYMQWYQPITRGEGYRTLVNSHLTWLAEFNWWERLGYLFLWAFALVLLWPSPNYRWFSISLAVCITFAVCASFSSIAEAPALWIIPVLAILSVVIVRVVRLVWPAPRLWLCGAACATFVAGIILLLGACVTSLACYSPRPGIVILGKKNPAIWIVEPNRSILGEHYGHEIRRGFAANPIFHQMGLGVAQRQADAPQNQILIFSGQVPSSLTSLAPSQVILINPKPPSESVLRTLITLPQVTVIAGEFSRNKDYWIEESRNHPNLKLQLITGNEEYIAQWMQISANELGSGPK